MKKNFITASLFAVAILLWLLSGLFFKEPETPVATAADQQNQNAALVRVRTRMHIAEERALTRVLRGRTASKRTAQVSAQITGQVVARPVERGQRVVAGELLCELAVDDRRAAVDEARALLTQAEIEYTGGMELKARGLLSDSALAQRAAQLETAKAGLARQELALRRTKITAPFEGIVETLPLNEGDLASPGSVCATVLDLDPLLITANIAERDINLIAVGGPVSAQTSTGQILEGVVSFVGSVSDDATRTYPVEITVDNPDFAIRAGLTALVNVKAGSVLAQRVSPALFSLNDEGTVGLRAINAEDRVVFYPITIVEDAVDGAWVTGLPDAVNLITVGQEFVAAGQLVEVVPDSLSSDTGTRQ